MLACSDQHERNRNSPNKRPATPAAHETHAGLSLRLAVAGRIGSSSAQSPSVSPLPRPAVPEVFFSSASSSHSSAGSLGGTPPGQECCRSVPPGLSRAYSWRLPTFPACEPDTVFTRRPANPSRRDRQSTLEHKLSPIVGDPVRYLFVRPCIPDHQVGRAPRASDPALPASPSAAAALAVAARIASAHDRPKSRHPSAIAAALTGTGLYPGCCPCRPPSGRQTHALRLPGVCSGQPQPRRPAELAPLLATIQPPCPPPPLPAVLPMRRTTGGRR